MNPFLTGRVLSLATMAYESLPDYSTNNIAVVRCCQGCNDKAAGLTVANSNPKDLEHFIGSKAFNITKGLYLVVVCQKLRLPGEISGCRILTPSQKLNVIHPDLIIPLHRGIIRPSQKPIEIIQ